MYRGRRGRRGADPYATLLLVQLLQQIAQLERKPPVTLAAIAACFLAFYNELLPPPLRPPSVQHACLQPYLIVQNRQWGRLIWSALLHADEVHLCYNMASFLYKGAMLEPALGPTKFAALLAELLLLSHGLVVGLSAAAAHLVPEYRYLWFSSCAVGFSAVVFALKVVLSCESPGYSQVFGLRLPTKYMAWAELFIASALNPRASFMGHLCGILAGLLHVKVLVPGAAQVMQALRRYQQQQQQQQRQRRRAAAAAGGGGGGYAPSGTTSSRPATAAAAAGGSGSAAVAAAAAQQRLQAQQQRGIPAARREGLQYQQGQRLGGGGGGGGGAGVGEMQQQQLGVGGGVGNSSSSQQQQQQLSPEQLRQRRLQRFNNNS